MSSTLQDDPVALRRRRGGSSAERAHRPPAVARAARARSGRARSIMPRARRRRLAEVRLDDPLVVLDLLRRALRDLLAVVEHRDAVGDAHDDLHVVLDEEHGQALLLPELGDELGERRGLLRVHARGGLVEQEQLRLGRERAGDLEPALVAVGQVPRELRRRGPRGPRSAGARSPGRGTPSPRAGRGGSRRWSRGCRPSCGSACPRGRSRAPSCTRTAGCSGTCGPRRAW